MYGALRSVEPKSHEALKGEAKWGGGDDVKPAYQSVKLVSSSKLKASYTSSLRPHTLVA